jgi:hypothetical protein
VALPRLVDQARVLLWFQALLSVVGFAVVLMTAVLIFPNRPPALDVEPDPGLRRLSDLMFQMMMLFVAIAVVAGICATLLWRGWKWVYLLALLAQAGAVAVVAEGFLTGLGGGLAALLYAGLAAWILADLFRGEVLRYVWLRR